MPRVGKIRWEWLHTTFMTGLAAKISAVGDLLYASITHNHNLVYAALSHTHLVADITNIGQWSTYAYNAANFDAFGDTTWTVDDADEAIKYTIVGKTLILAFNIMTTSVNDSNSSWLMITLPEGKLAAVAAYFPYWLTNAGATGELGLASSAAGDGKIYLSVLSGAGKWNSATNTTGVRGSLVLEIQ